MALYNTILGSLLTGIFFNTFLYGLVTYQFAAYYRTRFNDRPAVKYMVLFLFILDTFHSGSAIYLAWYYTVTNYDNPASIAVAVWPYIFTPSGTALAAFVTQIYLGFRIWRFTKSNILYGVVILLAIPSFILGMLCSVEAYDVKSLSELSRITPFATAWLSMQVIVDTFITVTLAIVFSRSRTGFHKTDSVLNRLIRGAIQAGLFAGLFSLADLITFVFLPNSNLSSMFTIPIGRIYTNTLMDSLLTRELLKAKMLDRCEVSTACCPAPATVTGSSLVPIPAQSSSVSWAPADLSQAISAIQPTGVQPETQKAAQEMRDCSSCEGTECTLPPPVVV